MKFALFLPLRTALILAGLSVWWVGGHAQNRCGSQVQNPSPPVTEADYPKTEITIPVVVHNVYFNEEQLLSDAQIQSQIDVLNEDFRAMNADIEDVIFFYTSRVGDLEINFVLADEDPHGNPHSGIIRRATTIAGIGGSFTDQRRNLCYDELEGSSAWCTDCYLNIWVADLANAVEGLAGIGIFPTQIASGEVPRAEDGVYIQYDNFGRGGITEAPYDLGRTGTHEVGHYLNLLHPWGAVVPPDDCSPSVCCDDPQYDDLVEDTGKQIATYANRCPSGTLNDCPGTTEPDNYQNFMGYVEDACAIMFTQGQKARVWSALATYRSGFLNPNCTVDICLVGTRTPRNVTTLFRNAHYADGELRVDALDTELDWRLYRMDGRPVGYWKTISDGLHRRVTQLPGAGVYILTAVKNDHRQVVKLVVL